MKKINISFLLYLGLCMSLCLNFITVYAAKKLVPETLDGAKIVKTQGLYELVMSQEKLVIIDSRLYKEYNKGHIQGSISLQDNLMSENKLKDYVPTKSTPLLFYCNGIRCFRSYNASNKALKWGYTNIYWYREGWKDWKKKGMPISL